MREAEIQRIAGALGRDVGPSRTLAGGFSHETCLLTVGDGVVVARVGGPDPEIEAAVIAVARPHAPVPGVLRVLPATGDARPIMLVEYVAGTPLSEVLADASGADAGRMRELGAEVGRVVAGIAAVRFDRPGFFTGTSLAVRPGPPWSAQLPGMAAACMAAPGAAARLDPETRLAWTGLCAAHAPALTRVDSQARLVHADINPKNILVSEAGLGWRVDAVLDWEFAYSGCPYGDAANMARFGADYPPGFLDGFVAAFAAHRPAGLPPDDGWEYLGRVLDMFALSDLVTRPAGNPVADQAAALIRQWVAAGVPGGN
ncbi:MAG: phosphotransferase family protein [Streptosporangiaceae bacterium]